MFVSLYLIPSYFFFVVSRYQQGETKPFHGDFLVIALEFFGGGIIFSLLGIIGAAIVLGLPIVIIMQFIKYIQGVG